MDLGAKSSWNYHSCGALAATAPPEFQLQVAVSTGERASSVRSEAGQLRDESPLPRQPRSGRVGFAWAAQATTSTPPGALRAVVVAGAACFV